MNKLLFIPFILLTIPLLINTCNDKEPEPSCLAVVKVTMYTIDPRQTDDTPTITASGFNVGWKNPKKHRIIAISRDLKKRFKYGSYVRLEGCGKYDGVYRIEDLMNKRFRNRIDILINPNDKPTMFAQAKLYSI